MTRGAEGAAEAGRAEIVEDADNSEDIEIEDDQEIEARYAFARRLAEEAGALGMRYFADLSALEVESKGHQDQVSNADRALETHLRAAIAQAWPRDGVVGEEHGVQAGESGFVWVLDPIDGTANFVRGVPCWSVVIACMRRERPVIGVIRDPNVNETFHAALGRGAFVGDRPIAVAQAAALGEGSVAVGYSGRISWRGAAAAVNAVLADGGVFYRNASGAIMLAYVAAGRLLGYIEAHMQPWDCVAGLLLIQEAGGRVEPYDGARMLARGGRVVAGAPGVYQRLREIADAAYE